MKAIHPSSELVASTRLGMPSCTSLTSSRRRLIVSNAAQNDHQGLFTASKRSVSKQRSQAVAAPERENAQIATSSRSSAVSQESPTTKLSRPSFTSWLPWSQQNNIPLANQLQPRTGPSLDDAALISDGMATAVAPPSPRGKSSTKKRIDEQQSRPVQIDHAALQLVRQRAISKSKPGERKDNFKLGLVVEGGGMRGCVSGGSLQALHDLGLRDAFDAVYGSSAGAINASFFLAEQLDAVAIYHDHIASEEFINLKRWISRKPGLPPALNLDYLLGHVCQNVHPLDFEKVISSPIPLKVVASSLDALSPVLLSDFEDREDLIRCLHASANVPEVAGAPVVHRGHRLVDAAVFEAVPFRSAIADGCTHVLVLCTRPAPARKSLLDQALADALESAIKKFALSPDYMVPAWQAELETLMKDGLSQDEMLLRSFDEEAEQLPWFAGSHCFPVYPHGAMPSPLCTDVAQLKSGVAAGRRATMTVMKAVLGDVVDFSGFVHEVSNIVPIRKSVGGSLTSSIEEELAELAV